MKKLSILFTAIALVLGLSQCKKKEVKPEATDQGIFITLDASYNGAKTGFDPATGNFVWTDGETEYINVGGSTSGYLGQLTGTGNGTTTIAFSGTLSTTPTAGETLYFMYLGNGNHAGATTLDFSNQAGTLAGVTDYHIAVGSEVYSGQTSYTATLETKVAFARIDMSAFSGETVYVHGDDIYATATIDYTAGTISGDVEGFINVGTGSADKFVALIPQTVSQTTTMNFDSNSKSGNMVFLNGIQAGKFYANTGGSALQFLNAPQSLMGSSSGLFSLAETSGVITSMVRFAPGNLQYQPSTATWRFAEHQYDMAANDYSTITIYIFVPDLDGSEYELLTQAEYEALYQQYHGTELEDHLMIFDMLENAYRADSDKWIDLFGWGTWGEGKIPYNMSYDDDDYQWSTDFCGTISNNGNTGWRTLTCNGDRVYKYEGFGSGNGEDYFYNYDWGYLLYNRSCGSRFAKAYLDTDDDGNGDTHGLIMIPDNYIHPNGLTALAGINNEGNTSWDGNEYNTTEWALMEAAGAVFLPCSGNREPSPIGEGIMIYEFGNEGDYWGKKTANVNESNRAQTWGHDWFYNEGGMGNSRGCSVRLVRDVQ